MSKIESSKFIIPYCSIYGVIYYYAIYYQFIIPFGSPNLHCQLCGMFCKFLRKYVWRDALFKKLATLHAANYLTVNSVMDMFLQILQDFENITVFKTIFKNIFC